MLNHHCGSFQNLLCYLWNDLYQTDGCLITARITKVENCINWIASFQNLVILGGKIITFQKMTKHLIIHKINRFLPSFNDILICSHFTPLLPQVKISDYLVNCFLRYYYIYLGHIKKSPCICRWQISKIKYIKICH